MFTVQYIAQMKIVFIHPDFGIGGAERLVLDAAIALRERKHSIQIVTNQFSEKHCFKELLEFKQNIKVVAAWLPINLFGMFHALFAYIKMAIAALYVCFFRDADVIFCDQVSAPIPILRLFSSATLCFYIHYPDQLLTKRESFLKRIYRCVMDWLESQTIGQSDVLFVNSKYTESVFRSTFPQYVGKKLTVLYPSLNTEYFDQLQIICDNTEEFSIEFLKQRAENPILNPEDKVYLSINRFEVKKNLELALHAFARLKELSIQQFSKCKLILAGGYDLLNKENIDHYRRLVDLAEELSLSQSVLFITSPKDDEKVWLYLRSDMVIYTPSHEHFGIVPLESMYLRRPVLAVNNGGPTETIVDGQTGFLRENIPDAFASVMQNVLLEHVDIIRMGEQARNHIIEKFSFERFTDKLTVTIENRED